MMMGSRSEVSDRGLGGGVLDVLKFCCHSSRSLSLCVCMYGVIRILK